jgi:protein-tyrosine phosphatase
MSDTIAGSYGGKKAWLLHLYTSLLAATGYYQRFRQIRWREVERLVFVCKGNICRSAYCEARARSLGLNAISRGLEAGAQGATPPAVLAAASSRGMDLSGHRPALFRVDELAKGDLVIVMEPEQATRAEQAMAPGAAQITLLGLWHPQPRPRIQDPFGMPRTYIENCLAFLDACTKHLSSKLSVHGKPN